MGTFTPIGIEVKGNPTFLDFEMTLINRGGSRQAEKAVK